MKKILAVLLAFVAIMVTSLGDTYNYPQEFDRTAPVVPMEILIKGEGIVIDYLTRQIGAGFIQVSGESVAGEVGIGHDFASDIKSGKLARGSISTMNFLMSNKPLAFDVVKKGKWYEYEVKFSYQTGDGKVLFQGSYLVQTDRIEQSRNVHLGFTVNPTIALSGIPTDGGYTKYIPTNHMDSAVELISGVVGNASVIFFPTEYIGRGGKLISHKDGKSFTTDLSIGSSMISEKAMLIANNMSSPNISLFGNLGTLSQVSQGFRAYELDGVFYGQIPLIDFISDGIKEVVDFPLPVYNDRSIETGFVLYPKRVLIRVIGDDNFDDIPVQKGGGYQILLPAGTEYRMILDYGLTHMNESPYFRKG